MRLVFLLFVLLFSFKVSAFTCRDQNGREYTDVSQDFSIGIDLNRTIAPGDMILFDLSRFFSCRNDNPRYRQDYMYLNDPGGITTILDNAVFNTSATVNGQRFSALPISNPRSVLVFNFNDANFHPIPINLDYVVSTNPGKMVKINAGDVIAQIHLRFYSLPPPMGNTTYTWSIVANNSAILTSGTCEINKGSDVNVDFGAISKSQLKSSNESTSIARTINVAYRCDNPVSMPINISLSADSSTFSGDLIKLSNENLGVQMYYQGKKVKPGDSIATFLNQGIGSSTFEFHLVKNANADINTGLFSGSAVLVMSAD